MISFIIEEVIGKIISLFMSQRWYMAILYTLALLALVVITIGAAAYILMLWLFRPEDFKNPMIAVLSVGSLAFIVALWVAFSVLQRRALK